MEYENPKMKIKKSKTETEDPELRHDLLGNDELI